MKFSELKECPFCGSKQFYTLNYMHGTGLYRQRFDGKEPKNNEDMYDCLNIKEGAKAYCDRCGKYIGNVLNDTLSKSAEKEIKLAPETF